MKTKFTLVALTTFLAGNLIQAETFLDDFNRANTSPTDAAGIGSGWFAIDGAQSSETADWAIWDNQLRFEGAGYEWSPANIIYNTNAITPAGLFTLSLDLIPNHSGAFANTIGAMWQMGDHDGGGVVDDGYGIRFGNSSYQVVRLSDGGYDLGVAQGNLVPAMQQGVSYTLTVVARGSSSWDISLKRTSDGTSLMSVNAGDTPPGDWGTVDGGYGGVMYNESVSKSSVDNFMVAISEPTESAGTIMCGYQGWFTAAGDDNQYNRWIHWAQGHASPNGSNLLVEMYPDFSEFDADELFPTSMTKDGGAASLYSSRTVKTIDRHVRWMREYGIDGVFVQRFVVVAASSDTDLVGHLNAVLQNMQTSCEEQDRAFALMYDVSGANESTFWDTIQNDWIELVDGGMVDSTQYVYRDGKPLLGIWGFGFKDGVHPPTNPADAQTIIDWFHTDAPEKYRATLFGGVPTYWRTLLHDSRTDPDWADVYRSFDVISPWMVGRFSDTAGADNWKNNLLVPDLAETQSLGIDYVPVIWPGFSWSNLTSGVANQIPRDGGNFLWHQAYNAVSAGVTDMIYVAMFDEVDEATAIYKVAPTTADVPDQGYWLTLDADGYSLPSDWYLRLAFEIGNMLRSGAPVSVMPTDPGPHYTERGTPLAWLDAYGLIGKDGFESADTGDTDSDRMQAWEEYVAGTIPTNALSLFDMTGMVDGNNVVISWQATTDRLYSVYLSTNLVEGVTNHSTFINVDGVLGSMSYTNATAGTPSEFYKVGVRLKP